MGGSWFDFKWHCSRANTTLRLTVIPMAIAIRRVVRTRLHLQMGQAEEQAPEGDRTMDFLPLRLPPKLFSEYYVTDTIVL